MATRHIRRLMGTLVVSLLCMQGASHAAEAVSYDLTSGNQHKVGRLGLQWKWQSEWLHAKERHLGGYWDASFARWRDHRSPRYNSSPAHYTDLGLAAVLRYQRNDRTGFYAEAGTGPHYLSEQYDQDHRRPTNRLVVNTHAGIGFVWKNGVGLDVKALYMSPGGVIGSVGDWGGVGLGLGLRYRW
jgi:lipid A 3-O-deacylase